MSSSTPTNPLPIQSSTAIQLAAQQSDQTVRVPDDVILEILRKTSIPAIGACRAVCKRLNEILKPDNNWQSIFFSLFPNLKLNPINNFRLACKKQHFLNSNPDKGVFATRRINDEQDLICHQIVIGNEKLYVAYTGLIKIFDINSNEWIASLDPEQPVKVFPWDGKLVGKLLDNTIKVWDLQSLTSIATLQGHDPDKSTISLITDEGEMICISQDLDMRIVNLNTHQCSGPFLLNLNSDILSYASHSRKLYLGNRDGQIIIFDLEKQQQTGQLDGHNEPIYAMAASNGKLYSIAAKMKVWNLESKTCESTWDLGDPSDDPRYMICAMKIVGNTLIYARSDDIIIRDLVSNKMKLKIKGDCFVFNRLDFADNAKIFGSASFNKAIKVYDFAAEDEVVLREIIYQLESRDYYAKGIHADALQRFSRMPPHIKEKVYAHLFEMLTANDLLNGEYYEGIVEDAFQNQCGQFSSFALKIRAIQCYLDSEKARPLPKKPLLECLGIVSKEQYSEKLKCRPEYLRQIGLLSSQDLEVICSLSSEIEALPIEQAAHDEMNFRDNAVRAKADKRRIALSDLTDQMSQKVKKNISETKRCGVLLYDGFMPLIAFESWLDAFQSKLAQILEKCNGTPALIVQAFQSSEYNLLAEELNSLVEEFKKLDNDHQIAKLSAYVNQFGILKAWEELHKQKTFKLSGLPDEAKSLDRLLQMGT